MAGLLYAGDTSDPARAKLYGDVQQKLTDIGSHLLFFPLELNRIDDALIERALEASPRLGRYRPWIVDLRYGTGLTSEAHREQLFHESRDVGKRVTAFDETMTALRFGWRRGAFSLTDLKLQDPDGRAVRARLPRGWRTR